MLDADEDDEDEESGDGRQRVELRESSISLEQVCVYFRWALKLIDSIFSLIGSADRNAKRVEGGPRLIDALIRFVR